MEEGKIKKIDLFKKYLNDYKNWSRGEDEYGELFFYYDYHPEFTIVTDRKYEDEPSQPWIFLFPNVKSKQKIFLIKYQNTVMSKVLYNLCDEFYTVVVNPHIGFLPNEIIEAPVYFYFYIKDSLELLIERMIYHVYDQNNRSRGTENGQFGGNSIFSSREDAISFAERDFKKKDKKMIYFELDRIKRIYIKHEGFYKTDLERSNFLIDSSPEEASRQSLYFKMKSKEELSDSEKDH